MTNTINSHSRFGDLLVEFEAAIDAVGAGAAADAYSHARTLLAVTLGAACEAIDKLAPTSIAEALDIAKSAKSGRREVALLLIRSLAIDGLLAKHDVGKSFERKLVEIVEDGAPDLCKYLKTLEKKQTFEKFNLLVGAHRKICAELSVFQNLPDSIDELVKLEGDISHPFRHKQCAAYLHAYGWTAIKGKAESICSQLAELVACKDASFMVRFERVKVALTELEDVCGLHRSFLTAGFIFPFIHSVRASLGALELSSSGKFRSSIEPRRKPPQLAEKKYPLHQEGRVLTITVPMFNSGPGIAIDADVELATGSAVLLESDHIRLGDIQPGDFALAFNMLLGSINERVKLAVQVNWRQLFGEPASTLFELELQGQDSTVDWTALERLDPYSLEVAEAETFVGRGAKVQAIGNRLLKAQMTSTYITGQKRIGKTSLAQAVLRYIASTPEGGHAHSTYLEYGEYCSSSAMETVKALGEAIYAFLVKYFEVGMRPSMPDFNGTLAPLNAIAKTLESIRPDLRFVVILDEFDEIHPDMYRYGPLAEAFFANLRTLAARKNLAFILVGGEKMPFIIGAQGDQLNKFVQEPLDYFSRSTEWTDYVELVTGPVKGKLNWEEAAINELFNVTNGHPFYTKLLCSEIFATAVKERDTEILSSDVRRALRTLVPSLDINVFAHLWKDGIDGEREQTEVMELKRLRVLVAFGRALRAGVTTCATIGQHVGSLRITEQEIRPIVDDFCRRDILKDRAGELQPTLPLFASWLREIGVTKLIASTLADDLETQLLREEDAAFVQAAEIEGVVKAWPLYRGHVISGETVRAWLGQVSSFQDQRLLFKLLAHLKFVSTPQIAEKLKDIHDNKIARAVAPPMRESKVEKRRDIWITYVDGPGKSGAQYARLYAKENGVLMDCVIEPTRVEKRLKTDGSPKDDRPNALVIVDDLVGTGRSLSSNLEAFLEANAPLLAIRKIPLFVVVLFATEAGETAVRRAAEKFANLDVKLIVGEHFFEDLAAFPTVGYGFWKDETEKDKAKALCVRLGTSLYKDALGYNSAALLITFPDTCPNNSLPILFASRGGDNAWTPIFARPSS